jgi:protein TonB
MTDRWKAAFHGAAGIGTSSVVSVVVHAALIGTAVVVTAGSDIAQRVLPEMSIARFLAPPNREGAQQGQREMVRFAALAPTGGAALQPVERVPEAAPARAPGRDTADAPAVVEVAGQDSVFLLIEVDSAATRYAWSAAPAYPKAMLDQKREGFVLAQWVVDETGYADTLSLRILEATSREFAQSVREALPFMRFSPAKMGGRAVRQLVQQEFTFRIAPTLAGVDPTRKPEP